MRLIFALLFILFGVKSFAQSKQDSVVVVGDKKYCIHKIKQGETLFGLSKIYRVPYSILKEANPGIGDALSIGDAVRVPCGTVKKPDQTTKKVPDEFLGNYIYHKVVQGETLYGISREYDIKVTQIQKDNPEVEKEGLKLGQTIKILKKDTTQEKSIVVERFLGEDDTLVSAESRIDSTVLKDTSVFRLALMLPFQFDKNKEFMKKKEKDDDSEIPSIYGKTKVFLEFFEGVSVAVDSLTKLGLNIQVFTYDTKADSNEVKKILKQPEIQKMNLVIGPAYSTNFVIASKFLKDKGVTLIAPFTKSDKVLENNPQTVKIVPSIASHGKALANYVFETRPNDNVIIVYNKEEDKEVAMKVQAEFIARGLMNDSLINKTYPVVSGIYAPLEKLKKDTNNVLIVLNEEESFSSKFTAKLFSYVSKDYKVTVFGFEEWVNYRNIEPAYWDRLNIHFSSSIDYKYGYDLTDAFVSNYFKKYYAEPSKYAFAGFDISYIFLKNILNNKGYKNSNVVGKYYVGAFREYQFKYTGSQNGIDNVAVSIFKYHDYKFTKVND